MKQLLDLTFFKKLSRQNKILIFSLLGVVIVLAGFFATSSLFRSNNSGQASLVGYGCGNFGTGGGTYSSDCGVTIAAVNIQNSTNCISSLQVTSGNTYQCDFPLTGSVTNTYSIPVNGIVAGTSTVTGQSQICTVINNSTPQAALQCVGIPTTGAAVGPKDVLLFIDGNTSGVDRGDMTIITTAIPVTNAALISSNLQCASAVVNATTNCTFTLAPNLSLPTGFQLAIGTGNAGGVCALDQITRVVTCTGVPTGPQSGSQRIFSVINGTRADTNRTVNILAAPTNTPAPTNPIIAGLPRTGGQWLIAGIGTIAVFSGILWFTTRLQKKKSLKTDLDK